jgi:hypothetical protein
MKTSAKPIRCKKSPPAWHDAFVAMIPAIQTHARIAFRRLDAEAREEAIQEVVCNACCAYARLVELKKTELAYPSTLARNVAIFRRRRGRSWSQVAKSIRVIAVSAGPAWRSSTRISSQAWASESNWSNRSIRSFFFCWQYSLRTSQQFNLPPTFRPSFVWATPNLANGETTGTAAKKFRMSKGRISQIRKELFLAWHRFQGDELALVV